MPLSNPGAADWSRPGEIGSAAPNSAAFNALTVENALNIIATFSSIAQYYARVKIQHASSPGFGLFHEETWAWSVMSDSNLLGNGNSFAIINEAASKMCFAIDGNVQKVNVFGGFRVDLETPNLTFSSPSNPGPGNAAIAKNLTVGGTTSLGQFTVATVPNPSPAGALIFVTNESGGSTIAYSDGTYWRRIHDRQIIS
jgi:hypothetical protein